VEIKLAVAGAKPAGTATRWHLTGPDAGAHNTPGQPRVVDLRRTDVSAAGLKVPPLSCTLFELPLR
jgi:alpha-N-arabinofuranosidase